MPRRRHARRTIVVDGVAYTWRYGDVVEIRQGRDVVLRRPVTKVLGVTWDDLEHASRKGSGYPLTPARVAALIRGLAARETTRGLAGRETTRGR